MLEQHGAYGGAMRATPASFTPGRPQGDPMLALLSVLSEWWSGSAKFKPIVVIAEEFYNKFAAMLERVFKLGPQPEEAGAGGGGAGGGGGRSPGGATPGRGRTGPYGGSMRATGGEGGSPRLSTGPDEAVIRDTISQAGKAVGLNPEQIKMAQAGFLSAFSYESNLRHDITRKGGTDTGWAQWVGPRLRHMQQYGDPHSLEANQKQLFYELTGPYKDALLKAGRAANPTESATAAHYFESGGAPQFEGDVKRGHLAQANNFYKKIMGDVAQGARSLFPPGTKFNSMGKAISPDILGMSREDQAKVDQSMRAIKDSMRPGGTPWVNPALLSPKPLGAEGASRGGTNIDSEHKVEINVHGTNDQHATARATRDVLDRQYAMWGKNMKTQLA